VVSEQLAGMSGEDAEDFELRRCQPDAVPREEHASSREVDRQVARCHGLVDRPDCAPESCPQASAQLFETDWHVEKVVGARVKPGNDRALVWRSCHEEDGGFAPGPDLSAEIDRLPVREVELEDQRVGGSERCAETGLALCRRGFDGEAATFQAACREAELSRVSAGDQHALRGTVRYVGCQKHRYRYCLS